MASKTFDDCNDFVTKMVNELKGSAAEKEYVRDMLLTKMIVLAISSVGPEEENELMELLRGLKERL